MKLTPANFPFYFLGVLQRQSFTGDALHPFTKMMGFIILPMTCCSNPCPLVFSFDIERDAISYSGASGKPRTSAVKSDTNRFLISNI